MSTLITVDIKNEINQKGYLAIDSTVNGRSIGGMRMAPDLSPDLIIQTARVMTLKYGFAGLRVGGAKAGIAADPEMPRDRKRELLKNFGQALKPFIQTERYTPGTDLGISGEDLHFMLESIGFKVPHRGSSQGSSGFYTGITVFAAAAAAARHIKLDLNQSSVAIEGFGSVGSSAARMFWERGIRVVAISTSRGAIYDERGLNIGELIKLRDRVGSHVVNEYDKAEKIDKSRLAELDVDMFSPCGQSYSITSENASQVAAKIISPGANVPFTSEAEMILFRRGILAIPDFVANCGGVLGASLRRARLQDDHVRHFLEHKIGEQVTKVIEAAEKENDIPRVYAERIAEERFLRIKAAAEKRDITNRTFNFALGLCRKGVIPSQVIRPIASRYLERRFEPTNQ